MPERPDKGSEVDPDGPYRFDKVTLRFIEPAVELRFHRQLLGRSLPLVRLSMVVGTLLYAAFGALDLVAVRDSAAVFWVIRYGIVCPVLLLALAYTFSPGFGRHSQEVLCLCMLTAGGGIVAMTIIGSGPGAWSYYAGLTLVVIYCSNLTWLRFRFAALSSVMLSGAYLAGALGVGVPADVLAGNLSFLVLSAGASLFASYVQELYARKSFIAAELLTCEKGRTVELLEQARAGLRARDEFLAIMGHELRTPLNAIIGFSEIMKRRIFGPVGSPKYDEYIDDIHNSGTHLLGVINTILDLSKAQANKLSLQEDTVDLVRLVDSCLRMFRETASSGGVRLTFDRPTDHHVLVGDARLLSQLFINLLSNAVKFTPMGGSVDVSIGRTADGDLQVTVADTGIGIGRDDLDRVFEPFVQVATSMNREHPGTGLGLPLAVRIAKLHGGALELSSARGMGTSACVTLPAARLVRMAEAPPVRVDAQMDGGRTGA